MAMQRRGRMGPGGKKKKFDPSKKPRRNKLRYREQSKCRFCRDKIGEIDYKDVAALQKLTTQQGKIFSRKKRGLSSVLRSISNR